MKWIILLMPLQVAFAQTFTLKSADLGGQFSNEFSANTFGCAGANVSPQLSWRNAPVGTKSFALTIHDTDAPTGSGFWHWIMVDIPATESELKRGAGDTKVNLAPHGSLQINNDMGAQGYLGPCPPAGDNAHQYVITIYALKTEKLGVVSSASGSLTGFMLSNNLLAKASMIAYFKR